MLNLSRQAVSTHTLWLGILSLSLFYLSTSLHIVSDITQFMPANHNDKNVQLLLDELQQGNTARLLILRIKGNDTEKISSLSRQLKSQLNNNDAYSLIHNGQDAVKANDFISGQYQSLYNYRYLLSPNQTFSAAALSSSLKARLAELRSGLNIFKDTLSSDPQNHFIDYLWKLSERSNNTHQHGVWFNKDKTAALLLVELKLTNFDLDQQQAAIDNIHKTFNLLSKSLPNSNNYQIDITGTASMAVKTRAAIQSTTKVLSSIALLLLSLLFWWAYRSYRLFFIAMLPLASAIIAALTITNLVFSQVHGIVIAFGITILGVCLDYPVHLFSHQTKSRSPQQTILSIWPTLRLGVITTVLAYLAMLGTDFSGLSQLSVFAISGLTVSLFVTRWIVPFWLQNNITIPKHNYLAYLSQLHFTFTNKLYLSLTITLFCILAIAINHNNIWSQNISDLSPIPEKIKNLDKELRDSVGAPDVNHVFLLKDKNPESLLQRTEALKYELRSLKENNLLGNIYAVTDFIPSKKMQRIYQQQLPTTTDLMAALQAAQSELPYKSGFFRPFVNDVEKSKHLIPLDVNQILKTPLGKHIQQDLFFKNDEWISIIRLSGVNNETALLDWFSGKPDIRSYYLNLRQATSSLMSNYQQTALYRFLLGSVVIGFVMLFARSASRAVIILLPVFMAVLLSISIQVLLGTHLTLFHILALLLIIGIGLDYSLFFDRRRTSSGDNFNRLHGIFISAASTLITFGILAFSDIPILSALGQTVSFGVLACFVLTLVFNINNNEKSDQH